jgi:uncharacterized protein YjbI with pentapeptide repeats/CRP-like cAMP-binding protein
MNNQEPFHKNVDVTQEDAAVETFEQCLSQSSQELLQLVLDAQTEDLFELAAIAGLDPLTDYAGGDLRNANLSNKELSGADLSGADLSGANLSGANLSGTDLSNANLGGANLNGANLNGANLSHANLSCANLSKALIIRAFMMEADISQSCLRETTLIRSNLSKTDLSNADLEGCNLQGANLTSTNLSDANLSRANLNGADLRNSKLKHTNFNNTDLVSAIVEGAWFESNEGISEDSKRDLKNRKAILPYDIREVLLEWEELNDSDREWMIETGQSREILDGTELIEEDVPIEALYIILQGRLNVSMEGKKPIATLSSGEVVGEMSFVRPLPPSATVEAVQHSCVWELPRQKLTEKLEQDHAFGGRFYKALTVVLSNRLKRTTLLALIEKEKVQPTQIPIQEKQLKGIPDDTSLASLLINGDIENSEIEAGSQKPEYSMTPSS